MTLLKKGYFALMNLLSLFTRKPSKSSSLLLKHKDQALGVPSKATVRHLLNLYAPDSSAFRIVLIACNSRGEVVYRRVLNSFQVLQNVVFKSDGKLVIDAVLQARLDLVNSYKVRGLQSRKTPGQQALRMGLITKFSKKRNCYEACAVRLFRDRFQFNYHKKKQKQLKVRSIFLESAQAQVKNKRDHLFQLSTPHKRLLFKGMTKYDVELWVNSLNESICNRIQDIKSTMIQERLKAVQEPKTTALIQYKLQLSQQISTLIHSERGRAFLQSNLQASRKPLVAFSLTLHSYFSQPSKEALKQTLEEGRRSGLLESVQGEEDLLSFWEQTQKYLQQVQLEALQEEMLNEEDILLNKYMEENQLLPLFPVF